MIVEVRFQGIPVSDELRDHALRHVRTHLDSFDRQITYVVVRLCDVNGPRGGVDQECKITVGGPRLGVRVHAERSVDMRSAIDLATRRVGESVVAELERQRGRRSSSRPMRAVTG